MARVWLLLLVVAVIILPSPVCNSQGLNFKRTKKYLKSHVLSAALGNLIIWLNCLFADIEMGPEFRHQSLLREKRSLFPLLEHLEARRIKRRENPFLKINWNGTFILLKQLLAVMWIHHFLRVLLHIEYCQYFALINWDLKLKFLAKSFFSLLLILLAWRISTLAGAWPR